LCLCVALPEPADRRHDRRDYYRCLRVWRPSIIAVVINYVKRGEARGSYLESHFRWQIRTFWFALLWCVIGGTLFITIVGIPLALAVFFAAGLWAIYRITRGWLALRDRKPMYQ